jgi:hypothetical protein
VSAGPSGPPGSAADLLARVGRTTLISGLVAGLVGGLLGLFLAETIGGAGEDTATSEDGGGSFYDSSSYHGIELGTGDVQLTLTWDGLDDLDLHVFDPDGQEIYFGAPTSASGGQLDVDSNAGCGNTTSTPVENVFWPEGGSPSGQYQAEVHYFADCDATSQQSYELVARVDGEVVDEQRGTLSPDETQQAADFDRDEAGGGGGGGLRGLVARMFAWAVFGGILGAGLGFRGGQQKIVNGLIGGAAGGAVGGLLFQVLQAITDGGFGGRLFGFIATGIGVGLGIGIVEHLRREAWLVVTSGPMAGKELILYKPTTTVGSSPKCDIVLVKDHEIGPEHLRLQRDERGAVHASSPAGLPVAVNGVATTSARLSSGDVIGLGGTQLTYQERAMAPPTGGAGTTGVRWG